MGDLAETTTVKEYAEARGVNEDKVLFWIGNGELRAINVARQGNGQRPRYRIPLDAIREFEAARSTCPPPKPSRRSRSDRPAKEYV